MLNKIPNVINNLQLMSALALILGSIVNNFYFLYFILGCILFADAVITNIKTNPEDRAHMPITYALFTALMLCKIMGIAKLSWLIIAILIGGPAIGIFLMLFTYLIIITINWFVKNGIEKDKKNG